MISVLNVEGMILTKHWRHLTTTVSCLISRIKDTLRNLVLRFALPKEQYYIHEGFHSVFHPIIRPLTGEYDGESYEDDNQ